MSRFQTQLRHVADRFNEINGETVSLIRGGDTTTGVTASPIAEPPVELVSGNSIVRVEYQAWAIDVASYVIDSVAVVPRIGDIIQRANGEQFRVVTMSGDTGETPYQFTTSSRDRYLINTQKYRTV